MREVYNVMIKSVTVYGTNINKEVKCEQRMNQKHFQLH